MVVVLVDEVIEVEEEVSEERPRSCVLVVF